MKLKKCQKHKDTIMVSNEMLITILPVVLSSPEVKIYKMERCDVGGWHIYWKPN